jgi:flagellar biosynthesis protein FlhF
MKPGVAANPGERKAMKTRRIEGTDMQAALREVRRTLGPDAVIVSTKETAEGIEIVAATSPPEAPAMRRTAEPASVHELSSRNTGISGGGFARLAAGMARPVAPATELLESSLDALGLATDIRDALIHAVRGRRPQEALSSAYVALSASIKVEGPTLMRDGGRVAVLGATGVGKTTTIAKLAAHFARRHGPGSVALVNADHYRIGASEQLHRYGSLLGVPVFDVTGANQLDECLKKLDQRRLVLIDTAGMSHGDVRFEEQTALLSGSGVECYLALSLNTQMAVLARTVRSYQSLALRGCILTKEDEAVSLGAGLSMAVRHQLPVSYVTTGPRVPIDIRHADAVKLVARARSLATREFAESAALQAGSTAEVAR